MNVHVIDGTYELFRHFFAMPPRRDNDGHEVGALLGVVSSMVSLLREGVTHIGVATDHVVESFRNDMYAGYKSGEGIDPDLWRQFHPLEDVLRAMGVVVWPMVDQEADDGLAAAATRASEAPEVRRVFICTPDKDLAQCVRGDSIVQFDRRQGIMRDEQGIVEKFGVLPKSIPDFLALVGDTADGFSGVPRWGEKSSAGVLSRYEHLEAIPKEVSQWDMKVRGAASLATSLREHWDDALLFRDLATLRTDAQLFDHVEELRWKGPTAEFPAICEHLGAPDLVDEVAKLTPPTS
jgi:5'-3' exonuclease